MSTLQNLQAAFQSAILTGDKDFQSKIEETRRVGAAQRVGIYADAYRLRLIEVLQDNFPGVHTLLGDEQFDLMARGYIDGHPSNYRSIRWYGDQFPNFIRTIPDTDLSDILYEMAVVDWTMTLAFDAEDNKPFLTGDMSQFTPDMWPGLTFNMHPSVHRLNLSYNVFPYRTAGGDDTLPDSAPQKQPYPVAWVCWRQTLTVHYRSMEVDEAWALDAALAGENFSSICGGLTEWIDEDHAALRAVEFLKRWLIDDMIIGVDSK